MNWHRQGNSEKLHEIRHVRVVRHQFPKVDDAPMPSWEPYDAPPDYTIKTETGWCAMYTEMVARECWRRFDTKEDAEAEAERIKADAKLLGVWHG